MGANVDVAENARDAAVDAGHGANVDAFARATVLGGKSIGHTSVVFKLKLSGGLAAAYKPHSKRGGRRYRGELGAYRLARALGLENVPLVVPRSVDRGAMLTALGGPATQAGKLFDDEAVASKAGQVDGVLIPWIERLEFLPLESPEWRPRWQGWLAKGSRITDADRPLAAQVSTLVAFDYVTGNWDRWSGGNVGFSPASNTVLFIDNDGAFFDPAPPPALGAQKALLLRVHRFSKRFVAALRPLDAAKLAEIFGDDPGDHAPLFGAKNVAAVDERRNTVVRVVDERIASDGEAEALSFE